MAATDVKGGCAAVLGTSFMVVAVRSRMGKVTFGHEMKGALKHF